MKTLKNSIITAILILILFPLLGSCQNPESTDSLRNEIVVAAREIMTSANTCALITVDKEGRPRVRAMAPFLPENDFTVWFGTNPESRKVDQIKNNPNVTLYYLDGDESGYVTVHGIAQIVNDELEKEKWWKDEWEDFYQDKAKDYLLIKVSPVWLEVISESRGIIGNKITWEPPAVRFDSK